MQIVIYFVCVERRLFIPNKNTLSYPLLKKVFCASVSVIAVIVSLKFFSEIYSDYVIGAFLIKDFSVFRRNDVIRRSYDLIS